MVRGTGKFKQKRGGGRNFSKDMVLDENGTAVSAARKRAEEEGSNSDSNSEADIPEESESSSEEEEAAAPAQAEMSRAERKELKKKQNDKGKAKKAAADGDASEEDDDDDLVNPNHVTKKLNIADLGAPRELSRKEREAKEKKDAQDRYWKLHLAGKTDQAKADLGRLAKIRAEREAALAKRKAESEAKAAELAAQKAKGGKR